MHFCVWSKHFVQGNRTVSAINLVISYKELVNALGTSIINIRLHKFIEKCAFRAIQTWNL